MIILLHIFLVKQFKNLQQLEKNRYPNPRFRAAVLQENTLKKVILTDSVYKILINDDRKS